MSVSKPKSDNAAKYIAKKYFHLLHDHPLLTKSVTSAVMAGIGNCIAQKSTKDMVHWQSVFAYATTGLLYVGPTMHYFYKWLETAIPSKNKGAAVKRVILDRFILAPPWLLIYFYILSRLEGFNHKGAVEKIRETFWQILKNNLRVWTIFQFINVNYIPQQFRVLFASCLAFFWNIYVAYARR